MNKNLFIHFRPNRFILAATAVGLFLTNAHARTWTSADGSKTFEGELQSYDAGSGTVTVTLPNGKQMNFSKTSSPRTTSRGSRRTAPRRRHPASVRKRRDTAGRTARSRRRGGGHEQAGPGLHPDGTVEHARVWKAEPLCKGSPQEKYPYLVDDAGAWTVRKDVRNVFVMCSGNSPAKDYTNDWMTIQGNIGPEIGIGHYLGHVTDAPVMILKSCIGNRSLGWDLLPPGSEPYEHGGKTQPGYRGTPDDPGGDTGGDMSKGWYAGCQYDGDVAAAKKVLENLDKYYPGAKEYEVAGFFWWQGDKDMRNPAHYERYEKNLIQLIKALRKDFDAPDAKFVTASLGQTKKGSKGGDGVILDAMEAVAKSDDPELKGKVGFVYTHPLSKGGSSSGHYSGNPETYMNVGEAMGKAMVELLQGK